MAVAVWVSKMSRNKRASKESCFLGVVSVLVRNPPPGWVVCGTTASLRIRHTSRLLFYESKGTVQYCTSILAEIYSGRVWEVKILLYAVHHKCQDWKLTNKIDGRRNSSMLTSDRNTLRTVVVLNDHVRSSRHLLGSRFILLK